MKKIMTMIVIVLIMVLSNFNTIAQSTFAWNTPNFGVEFIGWTPLPANAFPLRIEHQGKIFNPAIQKHEPKPILM